MAVMATDRLVCMECGGELRRMTVTLDFHPLGHKNVPPTIHPPRPASPGGAQPTRSRSSSAGRRPTVPDHRRGDEAPRGSRKPSPDPVSPPGSSNVQRRAGRSRTPPGLTPGSPLAAGRRT